MHPYSPPSAHVCTPPSAALPINLAQLALTTRYTDEQRGALLKLYRFVQRHQCTGGGNAAAKLLLSLYNGPRFPFDTTELRRLDDGNLNAALTVIEMDARQTHAEVHEVLNALLGRTSVGHEMELWAYSMRLPKRCKAAALAELTRLMEQDAGGAA